MRRKILTDDRSAVRWADSYPALVFAAIFAFIFLLHLPLLQLPYFWDEAGYYVPAARDLLLTGSLIPHSTVSNAHPPLVMAWLAAWWKVVGYAPLVTRTAMLVLAAFSLMGVFRLADRVANTKVAVASTLSTALYPVFFAQSSLALIDLAAGGFTFWALAAYVEDKTIAAAVWFSLGALAKETAIIAPLALAAWEIIGLVVAERWRSLWLSRRSIPQGLKPESCSAESGASGTCALPDVHSQDQSHFHLLGRIALLLFPAIPLVLWYAYHYMRTGYVFGNPEFFRYNVAGTLSLTRFLLGLAMRLWQVTGYLHLWVLALIALAAMCILAPQKDGDAERGRIAIPVQMLFCVVIVAYVVAMSLIGGAVLARYTLPAVPLVIILLVSTLWRRLPHWQAAIAFVALAFVTGWFWNPPYGFSPEDNLAYRDYVVLHQDGERFLEARYPMARVLTAWPATDEITRPWLGYTTRPMREMQIENFSLDEVVSAATLRSNYEVALVFSTKYEPSLARRGRWETWTRLKTRFFGFHRDLAPAAAAQILGGRIVFTEERKGQWIAVIEIERVEVAGAHPTSRPKASFALYCPTALNTASLIP